MAAAQKNDDQTSVFRRAERLSLSLSPQPCTVGDAYAIRARVGIMKDMRPRRGWYVKRTYLHVRSFFPCVERGAFADAKCVIFDRAQKLKQSSFYRCAFACVLAVARNHPRRRIGIANGLAATEAAYARFEAFAT